MSTSLILACLWALVANVLAMTPSKDMHWRNAYFLIAAGIPLVGYVTWQNGPWVGVAGAGRWHEHPAVACHLFGPLDQTQQREGRIMIVSILVPVLCMGVVSFGVMYQRRFLLFFGWLLTAHSGLGSCALDGHGHSHHLRGAVACDCRVFAVPVGLCRVGMALGARARKAPDP